MVHTTGRKAHRRKLEYFAPHSLQEAIDLLRQGGASQGIGIAMSEEMLYDDKGRLLHANLLDYRLPTTRDVPPIEAIIVEVPSEEGPNGARIVGEPSIVAGAATVANAVTDAVGARLYMVPVTPERVLRALGKI